MTSREQITNRQLWFILFMMRSTIIIAFLPVLTSADALHDAWISALLTLAGSLMIVFMIAYISVRFSRYTVIECLELFWGKYPGRLLGTVFLWLFLQLSVVEIRIYGEVITTNFLTRTPLIFITGIMILASAICLYQGLEVLGRMADSLFFVFLIMVLVILIIPLPVFEVSNLQPVLGRGWMPVIRGSLVPIALISQAWVLGVLTPNLKNPELVIKTSLTSLGCSLLALVLYALVTVGSLGAFEGHRSVFPIFSLIRSIEISQFLQRVEIIIIFAWGLGLFVSVTTYLYAGARILSQWLGLSDYRAIIWPMSIIWGILTVSGFESMFVLNSFLAPGVFIPYGYFMLLFPLFSLWLGWAVYVLFRRRRELSEEKEK